MFSNFLFFLLDAFTWRPYYMPASGVGLPQLNFDAPRLLAHAYLFPIDTPISKEIRTLSSSGGWTTSIAGFLTSVRRIGYLEIWRSVSIASESSSIRARP